MGRALPNRLREVRKERGQSLTEAAWYVGVSTSSLGRWERGETKHFDERKLRQLAEHYGKPIAYLMAWE